MFNSLLGFSTVSSSPPLTPLTYHNAICFRLLPVVHTVVAIISAQQLLLDATVQIKTE